MACQSEDQKSASSSAIIGRRDDLARNPQANPIMARPTGTTCKTGTSEAGYMTVQAFPFLSLPNREGPYMTTVDDGCLEADRGGRIADAVG